MELNFIDFAAIGAVFLSVFFGFRKGLIGETFWVSGIILGVFLASSYQNDILEFVERRWDVVLIKNPTGIFIMVLLFTILIFSLLGRLFTHFSRRRTSLSIGNRLGGALFGLLRGLIITALVLIFSLKAPLPSRVNLQIYRSHFSPLILHYSFRVCNKLSLFFPQSKAVSNLNFLPVIFTREKAEKLDNAKELNLYQDFLDNIVENNKNFVPEQIQKMRRGK